MKQKSAPHPLRWIAHRVRHNGQSVRSSCGSCDLRWTGADGSQTLAVIHAHGSTKYGCTEARPVLLILKPFRTKHSSTPWARYVEEQKHEGIEVPRYPGGALVPCASVSGAQTYAQSLVFGLLMEGQERGGWDALVVEVAREFSEALRQQIANPLNYPCPRCKAAKYQPCIWGVTHSAGSFHVDRKRAAKKADEEVV